MIAPLFIYLCLVTGCAALAFHFVWRAVRKKTKAKVGAVSLASLSYFATVFVFRLLTELFPEVGYHIVVAFVEAERRFSVSMMGIIYFELTILAALIFTHLLRSTSASETPH